MARRSERGTKERGNGQGTVWEEKRSGKPSAWRWQVTLGYSADGKRITRSGTARTKGAAEAAQSAARTDYGRGLVGAIDNVTVGEYAAVWLRRQHSLRPKTAKRYGELLGYALDHLGQKRVRDVRPRDIKHALSELRQRPMRRGGPMSPRTLQHVRARLVSMFREAVSDQVIYVSPMDGVKREKLSVPITAGEVFDEGQAQRFAAIGWALETAGVCRLFPALFLAVSLGLRREEVMGLKWKYVDLDEGVLLVREVRTGGVQGTVTSEPKTKASRRDLPLPPSLIAALRVHREQQAAERKAAGELWQASGYVITGELGGPVAPDNLNRTMARVIEWSDPATFDRKARHLARSLSREGLARLRAEVMAGERLPTRSPHDLRHTYATLALRRGVPVEVVSKNLGHASISITLDIYRHVLPEEQRARMVDLFGDLLTRPAPTVELPPLN